MSMAIKWDGVTDADEILKALLLLIDEEDEAKALTTSYGDFGKYLEKLYKNAGSGDGTYSVQCFKGNPEVTLIKKGITYKITWNKAAKLIHTHLKEAAKHD